MTTSTLLNGHLYTEGYIIFLIVCIPMPIFHLSLSRNVCSKMLSAILTSAYIHPHYRLFFDHMKLNIDP